MEDKIQRIGSLIVKHLGGELNEGETKELKDWIAVSKGKREKFLDYAEWVKKIGIYGKSPKEMKEGWKKIEKSGILPETRKIVRGKLYWMRYAAAILLICMLPLAVYWFIKTPADKIVKTTPAKETPVNDIAPGGNKAVLTLSDGTQIVLDKAKNGQLATEKNTLVSKEDGQLTYKPESDQQPAEVLYHTLQTPRTGTYIVTLPDGSNVTLNSVSSLRYPTVFTGDTREVEITGEAYFEVAKNASKPFIVSILSSSGEKLSQVKVLGTEFNVMAYEDEKSIKTTLIEGSVTMMKNNKSVIIKPGQQAIVSNNNSNENILTKDADIQIETAWKNGYFKFDGTDLKIIMRQLARWYDVEVEYPDNLPLFELKGTVPRNVNISEVLNVLEYTGAHFKIEGKKITVLK